MENQRPVFSAITKNRSGLVTKPIRAQSGKPSVGTSGHIRLAATASGGTGMRQGDSQLSSNAAHAYGQHSRAGNYLA